MRLATVALLLALAAPLATPARAQDGGRVLVFSRTTGFRHSSIPNGIAAVRALGTEHGFTVTATEDPTTFSEAGLAGIDAVVFLNTTGDVLNEAQQAAFEAYVRGGGGFVGVHAAADTEYDWAWYGGLVGAYFASHPAGTPDATVHVVDRVHPATSPLPATWPRTDEWYNFRQSPRGDVHVLATLDETTFSGGTMGGDHPIAWCHAYDGGRSFYTAGGHTEASYAEPLYRAHLWGGLAWAAGWADGGCSATVETSWEITTLDGDVTDPMELAVAPDGRVFFVERGGAVKLYDMEDGHTHVLARLAVTTSYEDGLLGITLDPDFATTGWLYLYYSPSGSEPIQRVSRFTLSGETLNLSSEAVLLTIRTDRDQGGHSGGSLAFGPDGTLYVATGDDTDPFESDGYAPLDERAGRASWDAQRTSGNPFDLRGKILRIRPLADGTIEIPDGNLFPSDGSAGRPEIFAMGLRNPFRISLDAETGWLYWGDVGPDAGGANSSRGPRGYDEVNQARSAGFFGWPYCIADNQPYRDFNFATGASGPAFPCASVINDSPHVSEAPVALPPARPAWAWYPYAPSPEFPDLPNGNGRTVMAGPVVRAGTASGAALPAYFDGSVFVYEWSRNWIVETHLDADGQPLAFQRFLPGLELHSPIDMELGPDGAFYVVEWGAGFGGGNPDAALRRIGYVGGSRSPVAKAQASVMSGPAPLAVSFTSVGTTHPDGLSLDYAWDLDGDGTTDATTPTAEWTYTENGDVVARLTVTDPNDRTATATIPLVVGNSEPVVTVTLPIDGGFFAWGDSLRYEVSAVDPEDGSTDAGTIDCASIVVQPGVGHDAHNHPLEEYPGCVGGFRAPAAHGADGENVFLVVEARYADAGASGVGSLTGRQQIVLRPMTLEAERYNRQQGTQTEATGDALGGLQNVGYIDAGDWLAYDGLDFHGITGVTFRVASASTGGFIEARVDAVDGPLVARALAPGTGAWQTYTDVTVPMSDPGGPHTLFLVFRPIGSTTGLLNLNRMTFHGPGVGVPPETPRGLVAEYFATPDLTGEPVVRIDPQVSFHWGNGAPVEGLPADGFSVRWHGRLHVPAEGVYRFGLDTDDGGRLWIDGALLIDEWDGEGDHYRVASVRLAAGDAVVRMEVRDARGDASANLMWTGSGGLRTIPEAALVADPTVGTAWEDAPGGSLALDRPRPNPTAASARIAFRLAAPGDATVEVFDTLGRHVLTLFDGAAPAGSTTLDADLAGLPSGIYVVRLAAGGATATRMLTVVR